MGGSGLDLRKAAICVRATDGAGRHEGGALYTYLRLARAVRK
jgi:hypothetical protein